MICVYKILSPDLQECYVGSTVNFNKRVIQHKTCKSGCRSKILFDKYGFENCSFVVLEQCEKEQLLEKEQWWFEHSVGAVNQKNPIGLGDSVYKRKYYEENKEKVAEYQKKYREENKEKVVERKRKYYEENKEANKEKEVERQRKYYEANKEKVAERSRKYYEANKEQLVETQRKYREANKEKRSRTPKKI